MVSAEISLTMHMKPHGHISTVCTGRHTATISSLFADYFWRLNFITSSQFQNNMWQHSWHKRALNVMSEAPCLWRQWSTWLEYVLRELAWRRLMPRRLNRWCSVRAKELKGPNMRLGLKRCLRGCALKGGEGEAFCQRKFLTYLFCCGCYFVIFIFITKTFISKTVKMGKKYECIALYVFVSGATTFCSGARKTSAIRGKSLSGALTLSFL